MPNASIGEALSRARQDAGLTTQQVAESTRIRRTLVEAIERDDFSMCGGDVYARGHIATLARTIGVDPAPLLAEFDGEPPRARLHRGRRLRARDRRAAERRGPNWSAAMGRGPRRRRRGGGLPGRHQPLGRPGRGAAVAVGPRGASTADPRAERSGRHSLPDADRRDRGGSRPLRRDGRPDLSPAASRWVSATQGAEQVFSGLLDDGTERTFSDPERVKLDHRQRRRRPAGRRRRRPRHRWRLRRGRPAHLRPRRPHRGGRLSRRPAAPALSRLCACPAPSPSSPWAAPATRSTPRSSPAGWRPTAGSSSTTRPRPTWCWSTPAGSSSRPRRTPSTPCWRPPTSRATGARPRPSSRSAAWPSATAASSPRRCPRPTPCSASTTTPTSAARLRAIVGGAATGAHAPRDRRLLLPLTPVDRAARRRWPGPASGPRVVRRRLDGGPVAPLKLASGCDRRCSFCAIPSFRGAFVSRRPDGGARRGPLAGRAGRPRARSW